MEGPTRRPRRCRADPAATAGDNAPESSDLSGVLNTGDAASAVSTTAAVTPAVVFLGATIDHSGKELPRRRDQGKARSEDG